MLDKFDDETQALINRAVEEARAFGHDSVGVVHVILALSFEKGPIEGVFRAAGVTAETLRQRIEEKLGRKSPHTLNLNFDAELTDLLRFLHEKTDTSSATPNLVDLLTLTGVLMSQRSGMAFLFGFSDEIVQPRLMEEQLGKAASALGGAMPQPMHEIKAAEDPGITEGDLTDAANYALLFARIEAATYNIASKKIDSKSMLVGLLLDQCGWAGKLLRKNNVDLKKVRAAVGQTTTEHLVPDTNATRLFDTNCRRILQTARKKSRLQNRPEVSSMHLLWAILAPGDNQAKTILSFLIGDLASFKHDVDRLLGQRFDGHAAELELNKDLYGKIMAHEPILLEHYGLAQAEQSASEAKEDSFDLRHLDAQCLTIMEIALREFEGHVSGQFEAMHVLFALLGHENSAAANYLFAWGVTAKLARAKAAALIVPRPTVMPGYELDGSVAELLDAALTIARKNNFAKVTPEHLLCAMLLSTNDRLKSVFDGLSLDTEQLKADVLALCLSSKHEYSIFSSKFASIRSSGLHIYAMVCEPGVGIAMQAALQKAEDCNAHCVDATFLAYGLLSTLKVNGVKMGNTATFPFDVKPQAAKETDSAKPAEIDFDPSLEAIFDKALELSLANQEMAVSAQHLLSVLLATRQKEVLDLFDSNDASPDVVSLMLTECLQKPQTSALRLQMILELFAQAGIKLSSNMREFMRTVSNISLEMRINLIKVDLFIYAFACSKHERISQILTDCGLDVPKMNALLWREARHYPASGVEEPTMSLQTLSIFLQAEVIAKEFGVQPMQCEHLVLAILDAGILPDSTLPGLDTAALDVLLHSTIPIPERARKLKFGWSALEKMTFTTRMARSVLVNAGIIAADSGRNYIDCEHVLMALAGCPKKDLRLFLMENGLTKTRVEKAASKYITRIAEFSSAPISFSEPLEQQLTWAYGVAAQLPKNIDMEEILLAILNKPSGIAEAIFSDLSIERTLFARSLEDYIARELCKSEDYRRDKVLDVLSSDPPATYASTRLQNNIDQIASWLNRASMAYSMGQLGLSAEALQKWWYYCKVVAEMQGESIPAPPKPPEFYFGEPAKTQSVNANATGEAVKKSDVRAGEAKRDQWDSDPINFNMSLLDAETSIIIGRAFNLAGEYIFPSEPAGGSVLPVHIFMAAMQAPEYADLVFGTNKLDGLETFIDAVAARCISVKGKSPAGGSATKEKSVAKDKSKSKGKVKGKATAKDDKSSKAGDQPLALSDNSKAVLLAAFQISKTFSGKELKLVPEHLLLGILESDSWSTSILEDLGFRTFVARQAIIRQIDVKGRYGGEI